MISLRHLADLGASNHSDISSVKHVRFTNSLSLIICFFIIQTIVLSIYYKQPLVASIQFLHFVLIALVLLANLKGKRVFAGALFSSAAIFFVTVYSVIFTIGSFNFTFLPLIVFLQFFIFSPKETGFIVFFVSVSAFCYATVFIIADYYQAFSLPLPEGLLNAQKWNTVVGLPVLSMAIGAYAFFTIKKAEDETAKEKQDLKATQAQLIQQEKLASLGQLTAGIAHEIKNPLNFVNNFSEVSLEMIGEIREERGKKIETRDEKLVDEILEDIHSNLEKIHEHGARANGIVTSMLQHSRGASGKKEPTDLNDLVREYVNLSYHGMRAGKSPFQVEIVLDLADSVLEMRLVREDISRVIINLCNNAFDAMRERLQKSPDTYPAGPDFGRHTMNLNGSYAPVLRVATSSGNDKVAMAFEDNGVGIPEDIRDKILQPFFTTKKGTEGTGLGLSITHDILKAHGGELRIESTLGAGTVVQAEFEPSKQTR